MLILNERYNKQVHIKVIVSAAMEMVSSLHVLSEPAHHHEVASWVKETEGRISSELRREIDYFAEHYAQWSLIMDLASIDGGASRSVIEFLRELENMPLDEFTYWFFSGLIEKESIQRRLECGAFLDEGSLAAVSSFLDRRDVDEYFAHPQDVRMRLMSLLELYWLDVFKDTWSSLELYEIESARMENDVLKETDWMDYLGNCHEDITVSDGVIVLRKLEGYKIPVADIDQVIIVPSVFTAPHLMMSLQGSSLTVYKNIEFKKSVAEEMPQNIDAFLKAIGSAVRLKMLRVLRGKPMTTKELADHFSVSASTVSEHLRVLRMADLVYSVRDKNNVYYSFLADNYQSNLAYLEKYIGN